MKKGSPCAVRNGRQFFEPTLIKREPEKVVVCMPATEAGSLKQPRGTHLGNQVQKLRPNGRLRGLFPYFDRVFLYT